MSPSYKIPHNYLYRTKPTPHEDESLFSQYTLTVHQKPTQLLIAVASTTTQSMFSAD